MKALLNGDIDAAQAMTYNDLQKCRDILVANAEGKTFITKAPDAAADTNDDVLKVLAALKQ